MKRASLFLFSYLHVCRVVSTTHPTVMPFYSNICLHKFVAAKATCVLSFLCLVECLAVWENILTAKKVGKGFGRLSVGNSKRRAMRNSKRVVMTLWLFQKSQTAKAWV